MKKRLFCDDCHSEIPVWEIKLPTEKYRVCENCAYVMFLQLRHLFVDMKPVKEAIK